MSARNLEIEVGGGGLYATESKSPDSCSILCAMDVMRKLLLYDGDHTKPAQKDDSISGKIAYVVRDPFCKVKGVGRPSTETQGHHHQRKSPKTTVGSAVRLAHVCISVIDRHVPSQSRSLNRTSQVNRVY